MSKSEIKFVPPTDALIAQIAIDMRGSDSIEVWLSHKKLPLAALQGCIEASKTDCYVAVAGDKALCAFGVGSASRLAMRGTPWLLGTNHAFLFYRREIAELSVPMIDYLRGGYTRLENWVHADNMASIRWIRRCGFTVEPAEPHGPFGALFHYFWMPGGLVPCAT